MMWAKVVLYEQSTMGGHAEWGKQRMGICKLQTQETFV